MKDLKEFKYQHQLDEGTKHKSPRSRFDLYCGMLLGALAVGIIWPAATKWIAKETRVAHAMTAKKLIASNVVPESMTETKSTNIDKIIPTPLPAETITRGVEKSPAPLETPSRKAVSLVKENRAEKPKEKKISSKKIIAAKPLEKEKEKEKKDLRLASRSVAPVKAARVEAVIESEMVLTAADVQAKTDATLLRNDVSGATPESLAAEVSGPFITISAVQYDKSSLSNCKNRCLLKARDAKGQAVNAIISGPSFADILIEHQGTINLTGKKSTIKKHEVFLVQNITFNLPDAKAGVANSGSSQPAKSNVSQPNTAPSTYQGGSEAYEDLGSDLAPR
ncbi:MAG: hypothetical protein EOP07_14010 [Proteobacteria bacterium]|nr:MAG: hypothetical protein EOP07_14010 [Pseudomonadota bacterium]